MIRPAPIILRFLGGATHSFILPKSNSDRLIKEND
jgi:hypothetical protein